IGDQSGETMMSGDKNKGMAWITPLEAKLDEGDILDILRKSPALFRKIVAGASPKGLAVRPSGGDWSRKDVLAHMLDTEAVMTFRIRKMICEEDPNLSFFDQEKWIPGAGPERGDGPGKT